VCPSSFLILNNKGGQQDSMTEMNKTLKDLVLLQGLSDLLKKNSLVQAVCALIV
jgi:hypothetical protein